MRNVEVQDMTPVQSGDDMELTSSQIKYLLAIRALNNNGVVRSRDIARNVGVTNPSVHRMLAYLEMKGLITKQKYSIVQVTSHGHALVEIYHQSYCLICDYFQNELSLLEETAKDASLALLGGTAASTLEELFLCLSDRANSEIEGFEKPTER